MINETLEQLFDKNDLTFSESENVANLIMHGEVNNSQIAALLTGLRIKGETATEIAGFASAMRSNGIKINVDDKNTIDVCGTGGDNSGSFNISTAVAFVVAGAGIKVAKHGNRSITSKSGSSDVLNELGVNIELTPQQSEVAINKIGISFLFAPIYHPAMRYVGPVRLGLGFKTIFNVLGPLTNPANTVKQIIGTFNGAIAHEMAEAAKLLGMERVAFICTNNQYDEITLTHPTQVVELHNSKITVSEIDASSFNYSSMHLDNIKGGTPKENAEIILNIFQNKSSAEHFNVVAANAALALYTSGNYKTLKDAHIKAEESIKSGQAFQKLSSLIDFGKEL